MFEKLTILVSLLLVPIVAYTKEPQHLKDTKAHLIEHILIPIIDATMHMQEYAKMRKLFNLEMDLYNLFEKIDHEQASSSLKELFKEFHEVTHDYMKEAHAFKNQMTALIKKWSTQRDKHHTILLEWGSQPEGKEHDYLPRLIHSLEEFKIFLTDLTIFLRDLRISCKDSWNGYKTELIKLRSSHK